MSGVQTEKRKKALVKRSSTFMESFRSGNWVWVGLGDASNTQEHREGEKFHTQKKRGMRRGLSGQKNPLLDRGLQAYYSTGKKRKRRSGWWNNVN